MYETNSVLRKTAETEISDLTFWLRFGSVRVYINRNRTEIRFPHIPNTCLCLPSYSWYSFTDPEGWKAELAWVAGYLVRQFTCPKAVIHPTTSINRAQCRATGLIETNALPLHYTAIVSRCQNACPILGCTAAGDDGEDVVDKRSSYRLTRKDAVKSQLKKNSPVGD